MPDQLIIEHCSPTLAGLKTGSLFSVKACKTSNLNEEIRQLNKVLLKKGLRAVLVQKAGDFALVYIYRPDYLERDLRHPDAVRILEEKGYESGDSSRCLVQLVRHLLEDKSFPHEIGLFLGYPPEDVLGFMRDPSKGVKCTGCWKAYGNEEEARKTFARFRKCTEIYKREINEGKTLDDLIVKTAV